jgi:carboxymethylenebutenolidase
MTGDDVTELGLPMMTVSPADDAPHPGVVVIHEGYGITAQMIRFCERLAREGYFVVLPDLFFRKGGPDLGDFALMGGSVTPEQLRGDLAAAIAHLRSLGATSIGVTGFCMGGTYTYAAAKQAADLGVDAAVAFYGSGIADELGDPACPTLICLGGNDQWVPAAAVAAIQAHHGDAVVVYDGADHGFMRDGSDSWHESAATDGWAKLVGHFAEHLH